MTPRLLREQAAGQVLVALLMLALLLAALPAAAQAASATIRIEGLSGPVVDRTSVTIPSDPVAPLNDGHTCPGNSVAGAIHAAAAGDWTGTWADATGFSIDSIKGAALAGPGRIWGVLLNGDYQNGSPCGTTVPDNANLILFPLCVTATTQCFRQGPLEISTVERTGPGTPVVLVVRQTTINFDVNGYGSSQAGPAQLATVAGPTGSASTDPYFGQGSLLLVDKGDNVVSAFKRDFVPDRAHVCVTDGSDGFCGTTAAPPPPFDPAPFCLTTGFDGFCGTVDQLAPLAQVTDPPQGTAYPKAGGPLNLTGTAVFDPSGIPKINFHLMRAATVTRTTYKKRKVTVKKRVRGKLVKKRVTKRVKVRKQVKVCYGLDTKSQSWKTMKTCDSSKAPLFSTEGGDTWTYELPVGLSSGAFTLDARAQDGAGNIDKTPELGRNRITFRIA